MISKLTSSTSAYEYYYNNFVKQADLLLLHLHVG